MTAKRRWLPIVAGVAILLVVLGLGAVAISIAWMREHLQVASSSEPEASSAFEAVHARFPGRPPLMEMRDGLLVARSDVPQTGEPATPLATLHVLAWNPRDRRLARFELPFWLVRLKSGPLQVGAGATGLGEASINLRAEDIERHGPGVVMDLRLPKGERVLVWVE